MRIKENLPWAIKSPIIHLVQPSPTIPFCHEVVSLQGSSNGAGDNAIYTLAAQEKESRKQKRARQEKQKEYTERKERNLSCGFISPQIHQATWDKKKNNCFYDLRNNRSMSIAVERPLKMSPSSFLRSNSLEEKPIQERRKTCPDFEDILRDLGCESRLSSETLESSTSKSTETSRRVLSDHCDLVRESSNNTANSSESVFYDVSLDDPEVERSNTSPPADVTPRKSFSEETFDRNRVNLVKQRRHVLHKMYTEPRKASSDSNDEGYEDMWGKMNPQDRRRVSQMVDDLLLEIYGEKSARPVRRRSCTGILRIERAIEDNPYDSLYEDKAYFTEYTSSSGKFRRSYLEGKNVEQLREMCHSIQGNVKRLGARLVKQLIRRDCLQAKRDWHSDWITAYLQAHSEKRSE